MAVVTGTPILTPEEIREHIQDKLEKNHLLDEHEFSVTTLKLAIELTLGEFNVFVPASSYDIYTFPNKSLLMYGALAKAFFGQSALLARNTMTYTDGGLSIPVEERFALYQQLGATYQAAFENMGKSWKIQANIESGWGEVRSDYSRFPIW